MDGFSDVTIEWRGVPYTIPANRMMPLVHQVEDIVMGTRGVQALVLLLNGWVGHGRLSSAYAAVLRYAGCQVSDADVYLQLQRDIANGGGEVAAQMSIWGAELAAIISPPINEALNADRGADEAEGDDAGKT